MRSCTGLLIATMWGRISSDTHILLVSVSSPPVIRRFVLGLGLFSMTTPIYELFPTAYKFCLIYQHSGLGLLVNLLSVSHTTLPSLGQKRVSNFLRPICSSWGSDRWARHMYRILCSWRAPPWVTLTGIQGVQGVFLFTSGQASRLQALYSWMRGQRNPCMILLYLSTSAHLFRGVLPVHILGNCSHSHRCGPWSGCLPHTPCCTWSRRPMGTRK